MVTFREFVQSSDNQIIISEGGNVIIDDEEAERIDLNKINRTQAVQVVDKLLADINLACKKMVGVPIWNDKLFQSKKFLSGSAYHFFMTQNIRDDDFVAVKSSVGDIDTQCDESMEALIQKFLDSSKGQKFGETRFIGYKKSAGQFISLWDIPGLGKTQIDLELVQFKDGFPTDWSQFSHSSAWADLTKKIKGAMHKFLLQSLDAPSAKDMIIKAKSARSKDKTIYRSTHAFSVTHGIREKMVPVKDSAGNIIYWDGMPEYRELSTKESFNTTDLKAIFNYFFGVNPSAKELELLGSFTGIIELIQNHFPKNDWVKITSAFVNKLWGVGAQGLYRGDPQADLDEKSRAIRYICAELKVDYSQYEDKMANFYKNYK